jgi:hypothetical protein
MDPADQVMDPAERLAIAHQTAGLLIGRGSREGTPIQVERLVAFAEENGLDILADLWSSAHPVSLPGALWRLYLVKAALSDNLADASTVFSRGIAELNTIDAAVVGAPDPLEPREFLAVLEDILRGAFDGSFPLALERASAVARAVSAGVISLTPGNDEDDRYFSLRSLRWSVIADELSLSAKQAQKGSLR